MDESIGFLVPSFLRPDGSGPSSLRSGLSSLRSGLSSPTYRFITDARPSAKFQGRSYRHYDSDTFKDRLKAADWEGFFQIEDPKLAWDRILENITLVLDTICPIRSFTIKNYRPDWMTNELIEQIKDRDYFFAKAKRTQNDDSWNIAKYLRNVTNTNIRQSKREFILDELHQHAQNPKKFWKTIHKVVPSDKSNKSSDILLKDKGQKLDRESIADFINEYFINVGKSKFSMEILPLPLGIWRRKI